VDSILTSIKKLLGIDEVDESFDVDVIIDINSAFMVLHQLGVGPSEGFRISDSMTTWDEYLPESQALELVKTYIYMKVKLMFDPPASATILQSFKDQIHEYEWRLNVAVDPVNEGENQNG
jgi:hypothetical protein